MRHTRKDQAKLIHRIRRIKGQVNAIEKALLEDQSCSEILQTIAACRGAINGLMVELVEDHILFHLLDPAKKSTTKQTDAAQDLMTVVKAYLK